MWCPHNSNYFEHKDIKVFPIGVFTNREFNFYYEPLLVM
jgi:hypothetical protein